MEAIVGKVEELPAIKLPFPVETVKRIVFGPQKKWESHVMRLITMKKGGYCSDHNHEWPHWVFVIRGKGVVKIKGKEDFLEKKSYIFIPGNVVHSIKNVEKEPFEFLCIVPALTEDSLEQIKK